MMMPLPNVLVLGRNPLSGKWPCRGEHNSSSTLNSLNSAVQVLCGRSEAMLELTDADCQRSGSSQRGHEHFLHALLSLYQNAARVTLIISYFDVFYVTCLWL